MGSCTVSVPNGCGVGEDVRNVLIPYNKQGSNVDFVTEEVQKRFSTWLANKTSRKGTILLRGPKVIQYTY
jgi:hypothetical protein